MTDYIRYAKDVVSGKIVACEYVRLACHRFLDDLERPDLIFDTKKIDLLLKLGSVLHHYTGEFSGKPFILEPWQQFIAANIFGFYYKDSGRRRYSQSFIECARKQGKTFMVALFCIFATILDGEDAAQTLLVATSAEQARIAFEMCQILCHQLDPNSKDLKIYRNEIKLLRNHSVIKVLASDAERLDGFSANFACVDEYHAHPNTKVRDVIKSSSGARKSPHICTITTAGFRLDYPCYDLRNYCVSILKGEKEDDSIFAAIYELDEGDDWRDENTWIKCSPNLGVTLSKVWLTEQINQAKQNPTDEVGVRTKQCNQWLSSSDIWIPESVVQSSMERLDLESFNPDEYVVYGGVDLSAVSDLTSLSLLFYKESEDKYYFWNKVYLPETCIRDKYNSQLYEMWANRGYLTLTKGNTVDYDYILNDMRYFYEKYNVFSYYYDAWNSQGLINNCNKEGIPTTPFSQSIGHFSPSVKEFERLLMSDHVVIDKNPLVRWEFNNVVMKYDFQGNVKPSKEVNQNKIDTIISMIQALGGHLKENGNYFGEAFCIPAKNS